MCREQIVRVISAYDDLIVRTYRWCRFLIIRKRFLEEIAPYLPGGRGHNPRRWLRIGLFSLYCAQLLPETHRL